MRPPRVGCAAIRSDLEPLLAKESRVAEPVHSRFDVQFARRLARLTRLYWSSPDARLGAALLGLAVSLELAAVYGTFVLADANRRIYDALQDHAPSEFFAGVALFAVV